MDIEITEKKQYEFRRLQATEIFLMVKIIGKIGLQDIAKSFSGGSVKDIFTSIVKNHIKKSAEENKDDTIAEIGMQVAFELANTIVQNLPKCESEIYQLLSQVSGMKVKDIEKIDAVIFFEMIIDFIRKDEFRDFIKVVSKYIK